MKSKWYLISSIFQALIGLIAIIFFIILAVNGEVMTKWIITLFLAIAYVVIGTIGIIDKAPHSIVESQKNSFNLSNYKKHVYNKI